MSQYILEDMYVSNIMVIKLTNMLVERANS